MILRLCVVIQEDYDSRAKRVERNSLFRSIEDLLNPAKISPAIDLDRVLLRRAFLKVDYDGKAAVRPADGFKIPIILQPIHVADHQGIGNLSVQLALDLIDLLLELIVAVGPLLLQTLLFQNILHRRKELGLADRLEQIVIDAERERVLRKGKLIICGDDDDRGVRRSSANGASRFKAVDARHFNIHTDQVGMHIGGKLNGCPAGIGLKNLRDLRNILVHQHTDCFASDLFVVCNK